MDAERFVHCVAALGIHLRPDQVAQFEQFEAELYATNEVMNLTRVPREECWLRHFVDSLLFQSMIPTGASVLDIGTGPGFPAWPLAVARPDLKVLGLDSNGKMVGFLQRMAVPNLETLKERAEDWRVSERFDFVTGRAVAPLSTQLELSARPCRLRQRVVPMRGVSDRENMAKVDLEPLGLRFVDAIERPLPDTDVVRLFPIYEKVARTKPGFPRRWADMKRVPL